MTLIIRDSFDFYSALADGGQNFWDTFSTNTASSFVTGSQTRFGTGQALIMSTNANPQMQKAFGSNQATSIVLFQMNRLVSFGGSSLNTFGVQWIDGTTVQCSVYFNQNGNIQFFRGDNTGTLLGTYTAGYNALGWHQYQIKAIINNTTGEFHIRKDGNTADDFALTGQNTRSTANNFANAASIVNPDSNANRYAIDDVAILTVDGAGAPWNDWVGDLRAVQVMPNSDHTTNQFTPNSTPTVPVGNTVTTGTYAPSTNQFNTLLHTNLPAGTVGSVTVQLSNGATGNLVIGIYDSDGPGGAPGTLIGQTTAITNPVTGNNTLTFSSPPTVLGAHYYWLCAMASAGVTYKSDSLGSTPMFTESLTYSGTMPSTVSGLSTTTHNNIAITALVTPTGHYGYIQEVIQDGLQTYLADSTVSDKELFTSPGLGFTPPSILGVSLRTFVQKSDAGARSGQPTLTSGGTTVDGTSTPLSTVLSNLVQYQDVDPNTTVAWTASGITSLIFGIKVSA